MYNPADNPDFAPRYFYLFGPLNKNLACNRFAKDVEVKQDVTSLLLYKKSEMVAVQGSLRCPPYCSPRPCYRHLAPVSFRLGHKHCGHIKTNAYTPYISGNYVRYCAYELLSRCYTFIEVKIKFLGSEGLLLYL
jgi:hypothetical protein